MKPSASHLIESARLALEEHVAPDVSSDLAASAVRSISMILKHLQVRSEQEADILWMENRALKKLLTEAAAVLRDMIDPPGSSVAERITSELAASLVAQADYPSVTLLDEENTGLRLLVDDLLNAILSVLKTHPQTEILQSLRSDIRKHLDAQILRERALYFPVFIGPPV